MPCIDTIELFSCVSVKLVRADLDHTRQQCCTTKQKLVVSAFGVQLDLASLGSRLCQYLVLTTVSRWCCLCDRVWCKVTPKHSGSCHGSSSVCSQRLLARERFVV